MNMLQQQLRPWTELPFLYNVCVYHLERHITVADNCKYMERRGPEPTSTIFTHNEGSFSVRTYT
jgi:hypothetical protein